MDLPIIETINYRGVDIEIYYDENAQSPDDWGNTDAFLVYTHRDFEVRRAGFFPQDIFRETEPLYKGYFYFVVYANIHSGVILSLTHDGNRWDTSSTGYVLVKKDEHHKTKEEALLLAQSIIEEWNEYLGGEVYGYMTEYESCWGYYGEEGKKEMIQEAKDQIDYSLKNLSESDISLKKRIEELEEEVFLLRKDLLI
jgi:hypothetical protein